MKRSAPLRQKTPLKRTTPLRSRNPSPKRADIRIEPDRFTASVPVPVKGGIKRKGKSKTRGTHLQELQAAFNAWVRARDAGQPCISCERYHQGQWHAGHYRSVGSEPSLRFEPDNVHLQCQPCNTHLSGNLIPYRANLIKKIGLERVEWIEGPHTPKKLTLTEIMEMKTLYRAEVRLLKT